VRRIGVVLVGFALVIAACGSSTASTNAGQPTNGTGNPTTGGGAAQSKAPADVAAGLCALLSPPDLKTATGADYGAGVPDSYGLCTWRVGAATVNDGKGQIIASYKDQQLSFIKSSFTGGVDMTVSGHAGYWNGQQGLQSLWVDLGGGRLFILSLDPVDDGTQAIAQRLAEVAIAKI
jgi:hypothetical protein